MVFVRFISHCLTADLKSKNFDSFFSSCVKNEEKASEIFVLEYRILF